MALNQYKLITFNVLFEHITNQYKKVKILPISWQTATNNWLTYCKLHVKLYKIDNDCSDSFHLWLIIIITICFTLVASLFIFLHIWQKYDNKYNQSITRFTKKPTQKCNIEMVPLTSRTQPNLNARILKPIEEIGIDSTAYEKYVNENISKLLSKCYNYISHYAFPPGKEKISITHRNNY